MARTLKVLFRRDPARDRSQEDIQFEGYQMLWPDGRPVTIGLDAFCRQGQRLLGLGRHLKGCTERLVNLIIFPRRDREDDLIRIPGCRVRRFFIQRQGRIGRFHFLDGTPTAVIFNLDYDEPRVLHWCGLPALADGQDEWFDLAARPEDHEHAAVVPARAVHVHSIITHGAFQANGAL